MIKLTSLIAFLAVALVAVYARPVANPEPYYGGVGHHGGHGCCGCHHGCGCCHGHGHHGHGCGCCHGHGHGYGHGYGGHGYGGHGYGGHGYGHGCGCHHDCCHGCGHGHGHGYGHGYGHGHGYGGYGYFAKGEEKDADAKVGKLNKKDTEHKPEDAKDAKKPADKPKAQDAAGAAPEQVQATTPAAAAPQQDAAAQAAQAAPAQAAAAPPAAPPAAQQAPAPAAPAAPATAPAVQAPAAPQTQEQAATGEEAEDKEEEKEEADDDAKDVKGAKAPAAQDAAAAPAAAAPATTAAKSETEDAEEEEGEEAEEEGADDKGAATEEKTPAEDKDKKTKKTDDAEAAQYLSTANAAIDVAAEAVVDAQDLETTSKKTQRSKNPYLKAAKDAVDDAHTALSKASEEAGFGSLPAPKYKPIGETKQSKELGKLYEGAAGTAVNVAEKALDNLAAVGHPDVVPPVAYATTAVAQPYVPGALPAGGNQGKTEGRSLKEGEYIKDANLAIDRAHKALEAGKEVK